MSNPPFDTNTPLQAFPVAVYGPGEPDDLIIPVSANPAAAAPFMRWLNSGAAWEAFGEWYDSGKDRAKTSTQRKEK